MTDVLATDDRSIPGEAGIEGEKRLCLALLEDALHVALGKVPARPRERDEALEWIRSGEESPFSFERVCSELGIDASGIRRRVEKSLAAPDPPIVGENGNGSSPLPKRPELERRAATRRTRRSIPRRGRTSCPACGAPLHGPWREKLPRPVPLGEGVDAIGAVELRFCTRCVTLFVEGRFAGELRFGSRR